MDFNSLNNSDWQNIVYSILLLMLLLSGLVARKNISLKKLVKYFAIWLVVALVAISLYAYRFEFSDFKNHVLGEINPAMVQKNDEGQLIIKLSEDGHFYVNLQINGIVMRFMIDTGASEITLNLREANRLGFNQNNLIFNKQYQTANGLTWGASINLVEVKIGDVKLYNLPASVNSSDMGVSLLGMSFLRQFKKYEFYRDQLILHY